MNFLAITILTLLGGGTATMADEQIISMTVSEMPGQVEIQLLANADTAQDVEYEVSLAGSSTANHRGRTRIAAGSKATLSTFKMTHNGDWCARAQIREGSGREYALTAGPCAAD